MQGQHLNTNCIAHQCKVLYIYHQGLVIWWVRLEDHDFVSEDDVDGLDSWLVAGGDERVVEDVDGSEQRAGGLVHSVGVELVGVLVHVQDVLEWELRLNRDETVLELCYIARVD